MSLKAYLEDQFNKNPWTDESAHMHKLLVGLISILLLMTAVEFLLKQPFMVFDTIHSEIGHFRLVESIKSDGGKIIERGGKKIAVYPCYDETADFNIIPNAPECFNENGGINDKAFYHSKHYDDLLN